MTAVLEVERVSETLTYTNALDTGRVAIESGEVKALLEQNGSGKLTPIKIRSGYHPPDRGGGVRIQVEPVPLSSRRSPPAWVPIRATGSGSLPHLVGAGQPGDRVARLGDRRARAVRG